MPLSAAEFCTTDYALRNNIYNKTSTFNYKITPEYSDLKTYNEKKDDDERDKYVCVKRDVTQKLTKNEVATKKTELIKNYTDNELRTKYLNSRLRGQDLVNAKNKDLIHFSSNINVGSEITTSVSNRLCITDDKGGIGFVRKPSSDASQASCITYDCPTGWKREPNNICTKPKQDATIDKRAHCDERWYDWFSVPNYHLGNGYYEEKKGICRKPCNTYSVPNYATDPVDGARFDFSSSDALDTCVAKDKYFMGKYAEDSDYCPIALIHRMHYTLPENVENKIDTILTNYSVDNGSSNLTAAYTELKSPSVKRQMATDLAKEMSATKLDSLSSPKPNMQNACNNLNTKDRVAEAYNICKQIKDGTYENKDANTILQLKLACNAVFCNENDTALETINGKEAICIDVPSTIKYADPDDKKDPDRLNSDKEISFMWGSFKTAGLIILTIVIGILFYLFWTIIAWPKFFRAIWRFFMVLIKVKSPLWYEQYDNFVACNEAKKGGLFDSNVDVLYDKCINESYKIVMTDITNNKLKKLKS